jgi:hypothetical protein
VNAAEPDTAAATIAEAITGGKLLLNLRPRYEYVDSETRPDTAKAFTLRTLLGWETKPFHGLALTAQAIDVSHLTDDFNDNPAKASSFPLVADPDNTDINQLFLDYTGLPQTRFRLGRQSIKLDNVRFIGNVEFRQVMQVFNGLTVENKSLPNTEFYLAHLERVKNVFALQRRAKIEIVHAAYKWSPNDSLAGYAYLQDDPHLPGAAANVSNLSNRTLGLRADGAHPLGDQLKLLYTAEYAQQSDYADGDARIDADYVHFGIGPRWGDWYVRVDYELLGSNKDLYAFQTPLGTNHLFQGWADQFLTTPRQGIKDTYLSGGGKIGKVGLYAEYHDFKSDQGSIKFGKELDFSASYPFSKQLVGKFEYADFKEDDVLIGAARKADLTKVWLTLTYNY